MGIFIPSRKRATNKRFDYEPRFYNPEKDMKMRERMRIKSRARQRRRPVELIYFIMILGFAIYLYQHLG